ncbi:putative sugar phosphate/phosphate translocator [Zea mays]|uniref:Putative sugar phosphate/phosphate translocator n=1 Tax=Zea mays TaxID=4577 RepID=A0A1D6GBM2_MAIZE|nr:putative sugar phosphate/phosphate translocator [Zea mays]
MGDCVVEDGHGHHYSEAVEGAVSLTVAVELDERAEESREEEEGGGQRKKMGGIPREPSFSRWCRDPSAASASNTAAAAATSDSDASEEFELPLLPSSSGGGGSPMDIEVGATARSDDLPISPRLLAKVIGLIACWYTLSTCLTLYNKEMLGKHMWKFPAPFLMNTVHFTMQAVASRAIVWFQQRGLEGGPSKMSWKDYCLRVVPTALATALDINLSNISLVFITVTFATMCKSASPIFILLFAFMFRYCACYSVISCMGLIVFSFSNFSPSLNLLILPSLFGRLEKPSFSLLGIMLVVSFGVLLTVAKETEFNLWGFMFIMLAAVMAGFRWILSPVSFVYLWLYFHFIVTELSPLFFVCLPKFLKKEEYVTVAGIVKEAVTILVAVLFFNDPFTWLKALGLAIIIFGVSLFNIYKYKRFKKGHHSEDAGTNIQSYNGTSKYVILDDDTEDQDDSG